MPLYELGLARIVTLVQSASDERMFSWVKGDEYGSRSVYYVYNESELEACEWFAGAPLLRSANPEAMAERKSNVAYALGLNVWFTPGERSMRMQSCKSNSSKAAVKRRKPSPKEKQAAQLAAWRRKCASKPLPKAASPFNPDRLPSSSFRKMSDEAVRNTGHGGPTHNVPRQELMLNGKLVGSVAALE